MAASAGHRRPPREFAMVHRIVRFVSSAALAWACVSPAAHAQLSSGNLERLHADAVASFQHGHFSEAYGRFMKLADAGDAPSAELALFMFEHGPELFGEDWDVSREQVAAWARLTGHPVPVLLARSYPGTFAPTSHGLH
jgi:hypothetical protein